MEPISDTGNRKRILKSVTVVFAAALAAVACIHWLPVLSFFFSVPLYALYFVRKRKMFVFSVIVGFLLDSLVSLATVVQVGGSVSPATAATAVAGSGFFILPLLFMAAGGKVRIRYRVALAGIAAAISWVLFFLATDAGESLTAMLRGLSDSSATMLYAMVPEGFERDSFMARLTPELLYSTVRDILYFSVLPICMMMYAVGCRIAAGMARLIRKEPGPAFRSSLFYNDFFLFYPLIIGMCGIMAGKMAANRLVSAVSWNVALTAGLFFALQGFGILQFFMLRFRNKKRSPFFLVFLFLALLMLLNGWMVFSGCLLVAGVVELFVPIRARFDNKDGIDPTPGRGTDQQE